MNFLIVFLGSGFGGALRHGVGLATLRLFGTAFPMGTLLVNVIGSFFIAAVVEYFALKTGISQQARLFLVTGILGGFTTFSAFTLDAVTLYERGQSGMAILYIVLSIGLSILAFLGALYLVRLAYGAGA